MTQELCSILARQSGEPLSGTAEPNTLHFAMAWPKREWLPKIENMDNAAGAFARLIKPHKHQAILSLKSAESADEKGTIWLFPHGYRFDRLVETDYAPLLEQALNRQITMPHTQVEHEHVILLCTHGKRDNCCAKFGRAFAEALRPQTEIPVWEVSHLGGHRFAATLVVQPESHWYGQLEPADVPALLDAIQNHRILPERYRGNAQYPAPLQIAELWAWEQIVDKGLKPLAPEDLRGVPPLKTMPLAPEVHLVNPVITNNQAEVVASWKTDDEVHQATLTLEAENYTFVADCAGGTKERLIWRVKEVVKM